MSTVRNRNKNNIINNNVNRQINGNFDNIKNKKINISYGLSIFNTVLLVIIAIIAILALIFSLREDNKKVLFTAGVSESNLKASATEFATLYTYYTQAEDLTLQNYKGKFEVTVNNSSNIDFIVTDENGTNLTGNVSKGAANLPTIVNFNSNNNVSQLILKYKTSSTNISLLRIDLILD